MKAKLLFTVFSVFLTLGAMCQDNLLEDGDFEFGDAWSLSGGVETNPNMLIEFGNETSPPKYGEGKNLRVHWSNLDQPFDLYIYQKVTLTVGSTYKFSGAIKDAGSDPDSKEFWIQIVVIPVNGDEDMSDGPDWYTYGTAASILLNFSGWAPGTSSDPLGIDTTFDVLSNHYDGMFVPDIPNSYPNQGDTTIFTVPEIIETQIDEAYGTQELGPVGTEVEFYFILYPGQWAADNAANDMDFTYDEFVLEKLIDETGIAEGKLDNNISLYPNPSTGIINLKYMNDNNHVISLSVIDITGRTVWQKEVNGYKNNESIDLSHITKGYYFLEVTNEGGSVFTKKFIIK